MNFDTCCKECIWAEYDGKTQTGCQFNRIDKFRLAGKEVIDSYDEEKEFYVIKNSVCFYGRTSQWGEADQSKLKLELFKSFTYQVIFVDNGDLNSEQVKQKIQDWIKSNELGNLVAVSILRHKISQISVIEYTEILNNFGLKWKIIDIIDEEQTDDYFITQIIKEIETNFYVKINDMTISSFPAYCIINEYLNEKYLKFYVLEHFDKTKNRRNDYDIVNSQGHLIHQGGSFGIYLKDRIRYECPEKIIMI